MRRVVVCSAAVCAVALGAPSTVMAGASNPPSCFGQGAASLARSSPGAVGQFASSSAQALKGPNNGNIGQDGVPALKASCS